MSRTPAPPVEMPDLRGRTALVTGASDGVGVEIARALASAGAHVVMPVRNRAKGAAVIDDIVRGIPSAQLELRDLDLASFTSVRALVRSLVDESRPLDMVVLNAGVVRIGDPVRHLTADGGELHMQTNALAHAALLAGIVPVLRGHGTRVAVQCSLAANHGRVPWDDVAFEHGYRPMRAYAASKVLLGLAAREFARRSARGGWGIRTVLCHPGVALTNIAPAEMRESTRWAARMGRSLMDRGIFGQSAADAALPALMAVTADDLTDEDLVVPGGLFELRGRPRRRRLFRRLADPVARARAWALVEEITGARLPDDAGATAART
jgi:NAD(P)-dependent dehydrogenase (short-subunit alcohol dehydrogenase family)